MARTQPEEIQASFFRIWQGINSNQPEEQQQPENTVTQQVIDVNCNVSKTSIYKDDLQEKCLHFQTGQVRNYSQHWELLTNDQVILDAIKHYHMEFELDDAIQNKEPHNIRCSSNERNLISMEISKLLSKGVLELTHRSPGDFISNIFVRPKKDGSYRMILNLKPLKEFVDYHHFKMDTFQTALKLIQPVCFMASLDLKDAYYSIPVHPEHRKYEGQYYQFTCLLNRLSSAPRVFTKILKPVYSHLRPIGHICMGHIDDSLLVAYSLGSCRKKIYDTVNLFTLLGFTIHPVKSALEPTQTIQFHGFVIDSVAMTVKLPPSKAAKVKSACQNLVLNCNPTIREVVQVIGLIVSSFPAVQYAQLHYRTLESEKIHALKGNYESTMTLSQMAKTELTWWIENIDMASRPIMFGNPDITITTDASNLGWGAVCNGTKTGGPWGKDEADFHINYLEMKAVLLGLKSLCNNTTGKYIRVQSDNTTTVSYINEMGGIKSVLCNDMAQTIWAWCIDSNIWLSACHIPGSQNTDADKQSRVLNVSTEWSLCIQSIH